jgi:hypothetical protein
MKFLRILLLITIIITISTAYSADNPTWEPTLEQFDAPTANGRILSSVSQTGNNLNASLSFDRAISGQELSILNQYTNTSNHKAVLDLSNYHLQDWTLDNVRIDIVRIDAAPEKEVVGVTYQNYNFQIVEILGTFYSKITQGFYSQPYDGALVNYSIYYATDYYSPSLRGNASCVINSDYQTSSPITTPVNMTASDSAFTWATIPGENAILIANSVYWAIIDGSSLIKAGDPKPTYPVIYWGAEDGAGAFGSYQRGTTVWDLKILEALMNYTYIPWNQSDNSPLKFSSPAMINLEVNSSAILENAFEFSSTARDLESLSFESNQSVFIDYNLTLSYSKSVQLDTTWSIDTSDGIVKWNATIGIAYPSVTGLVTRYMDVTKPPTWIITGLYNSTNPTTDYGHYSIINGIVYCTEMTNGNWALRANSFNHLTELHTYDSTDDTEVAAMSILTSLDINLTIREEDTDPVTTGHACLTVSKDGAAIWAPNNVSISSGKASYPWDIDTTTSINGAYVIDAIWTNGTDAGFKSRKVVVYYPTSIIASSLQVDGFTDSNFEIRIFLEDTFTPQGLDGNYAEVVYSFDGGVNTSLVDHNNGTWTAMVSTAGKSPGLYPLTIYAQGYAIENKSLIINANLIHDTELLTIQWTNTDNISFVQTTDLLVAYEKVGSTAITGATVNVTIDGNVIPLTWDEGLGLYRITFNGTDVFSGFGTYNLFIQAWKAGYKTQFDDTKNLTLHEESTEISINWSHGTNITYVEYSVLKISYRMLNTTAISSASVTVTDGITVWPLYWNDTDSTYWIRFNGTDSNPGFGTHPLTILAGKFGYENHQNTSFSLTLRKEPTSLVLTWTDGSTITYIQSTTLVLNYTMSNGSPVEGAQVNVSIGSGFWMLGFDPLTKTYNLILNGSDLNPGLGAYSVLVLAGKTGFVGKSDSSQTLTVNLEPSTLSVTWSAGFNITYVQQTTLIVTYKMSDESPIIGAIVNVTINGQTWNLTWNGLSSHIMVFNGSDIPPGFGTHDLVIRAGLYGFVSQLDLTHDLVLRKEPTAIETKWIGSSTITYVGSTMLSVNYTMSNGTSIAGAVVYVSIDTATWNLVWDEGSKTYRWMFSGDDNPPGLGSHILVINASSYGFITSFDSDSLTIETEPTTLIIEWLPSNNITYAGSCILSIRYLMNSNNSAITDATVIATFAGSPQQLEWNSTAQRYYLFIDGDLDLPGLGTFSVTIDASRFGFDSVLDSTQEIIMRREPTSLLVYWANGVNNPDFHSYTYLVVEYTFGGSMQVLDAEVNVSVGADTWSLTWNQTQGYYQMRFNGSDSVPGVGTHSLTVKAWKYGFIDQMNSAEEIVIPVIPTLLDITWTNGNTISYVQRTTLQAFYRMYNETLITNAVVNVTINGVTLSLDWNSISHAYERIFLGTDASLGFTTYPITIKASSRDFQNQSNALESLTKQLEPTSLVVSWSNGNNITYFGETRLSVRFLMSNATPISTGTLNATINGYLWNLVWNETSFAYEALIRGDDIRLGYATFGVSIEASSYGFVSATNSNENLTIRLEDTYITFEWVPSSTISYLDVAVLRIYYRYLNNSPVLNAIVNASYVLLWVADYNGSSGAYEIAFTGSDIPSPALGPHTLLVLASKANHLSHSDISQTLTIVQEETTLTSSWLYGDNTITYVESATIFINYSITECGLPVVDALVTIRIGTHTWEAVYNDTLKLYVYTFTGDMDPPGRGTFTLYISATYLLHEGFKDATDNSRTLVILSESVNIESYWIGGSVITYVGSTTLVVNYTMSNGSAIPSATANVTIGLQYWDLAWDEASQTYRIMFNGSDSTPGLGYHELEIRAGRNGFDSLSDNSLGLEIIEEPTALVPYWSNPNQGYITYFEYTYLFANYSMSNGSPILDASVNVTVRSVTLQLHWNGTELAYGIRFNGSDGLLALGKNDLVIVALKYGFALAQDTSETLEVGRDPTTIQVSWSFGNNISYIEHTTLKVFYRMSNGSLVPSATIDASIGGNTWILIWNETAQAYCYTFTGNMDPPGFGNFTLDIDATGDVYIPQSISANLMLHEESTSATTSWTSITLDWTQNALLQVEYRNSHGALIDGASMMAISIDDVSYTLNSTNGVYWFEFNNTFDLGHHYVALNISKYGYEIAADSGISFDIVKALTHLELSWNTIAIDYLGQIDVSANYSYAGTGSAVPQSGVTANITIDDSITLPLMQSGDFWIISLSGVYLDLGTHSIVVQAQAYGYVFAESSETLTVNDVITNPLLVSWNPSNLTIEYTDSLGIVLEYTFYGGDVPGNATVNVTVNGHLYNLAYSLGAWRASVPGNQTGIGVFDASFSAWLYGYEPQTYVTAGLNITLAANSFLVTWQPSSLTPTYIDIINVSVVYTQDYTPISGAYVSLSINGTVHELVYSSLDDRWHFSIRANTVGLGSWNVTVTANKTGYADGWYSEILTILPAATTPDVSVHSSVFYYDEGTTVDISYLMSNSSIVPNATLMLTLQSVEQTATWETDHWTAILVGTDLGVGLHNFSVIVTAPGFISQYRSFVINVLSIPTEVLYSPISVSYAQEDVTLRFSYSDNRTDTKIAGALYIVDWLSPYNVVDLNNGTYLIQLSGSSLHEGNYTLDLTLHLIGYSNGTCAVQLNVNPIPTELFLASQIVQYQNESIIIQASFVDLAHSSPIDWAVVMATIQGVEYILLYDAPTQNYTLSIQLPMTISPGMYSIAISVHGVDCDAKEGTIGLEVLAKSTYMLTLETVDEIEVNGELLISVTAQESEQPIANIPLSLYVVISTQSGSRIHTQSLETNEEGIAVFNFNVPADATSLQISVRYAGSISAWPAESEPKTVHVVSGELGILDLIFRNPVILTAILGGISVPALGLVLLSIEDPIEKMKDAISKSELGLTRSELSERLGISSSKISAIVKDLLESNPEFHEVREGSKRIIRKG